jgi:hypothetical protein
MFQQMSRQREHAAFHFHRGHIFRFKSFGGEIIRFPGIDFRAARKNVDRRETVFGPGMNGEMRLGDHDDAGNSVRIKRVKNDVHNARFGVFGRLHHNGFHFMHIIKDF